MPLKEKYFLLLSSLFIAALVICNIITFKLGILWNIPALGFLGIGFMVQTVGILPYPVTFLITDLLSECYGKERANFVVITGFIVSVFVMVIILIGSATPPLPKGNWSSPDWHLKRVSLKLNISVKEKKSLKEFFNHIGELADLSGIQHKVESDKREKHFLTLISKENQKKYLEMKKNREEYSAGYFTHKSLFPNNEADHHLGQDSLPTVFEEFFLFFPENIPEQMRQEAMKDNQPLKPVLPFQTPYDYVFGMSLRAIFASMVAYLIAQMVDVRLFHFWKKLTKGKHLWFRNNASTFLSQIVDTTLVILILFYGTYSLDILIKWIFAGIMFKWICAIFDTPFAYLGVYLFNKYINKSTPEKLT